MKGISATSRVKAVDILRGAIMVLMAIDHVRVYSGLPAGGQEPGIFFTRWITHFCAPGFVFFAGASSFLLGLKLKSNAKLARYLITRGIFLVVLELTLIRFAWTFNFNYSQFVLAGVIWMLGWCMILLAALIWLKPWITGVLGLVIIAGQQVFQYVPKLLPAPAQNSFGRFWEFIYTSGYEPIAGVTVLYVLVPWIGVMAAGYGFGLILSLEPVKRNRLCRWIGLSAILLFVVIGSVIALRQSQGEQVQPFIFRLLNQRKYPASILYILMTLGPLIALIPLVEKATGWFANVLTTFGRVPFFYYLLHIPLIHISALIVNLVTAGSTHQESYATAPYVRIPPEQQWNLALLYLVFIIDVVLLYFACRAYDRYKFSHPEVRWLKYI